MKYNIKNFKNTTPLTIGPLRNATARRDIFSILHNHGFTWNSGCSLKSETNFNPYVVLNQAQSFKVSHGSSYLQQGDLISYETFMEHNKPVYRIKTKEELLQVPGIIIHSDRKLEVPNTNTIIDEMFLSLGKEISKESFETVMAGPNCGATIIGATNYHWPKWAVTDEPLNVEERKVVAYKLVKEYPGRKVGDVAKYQFEKCDSHFLWETDEKKVPTEFQPDLCLDWWEPVYEEEKTEIEVEVGTPKKKVRILKDGTYFLPDYSKSGTIDNLKFLSAFFNRTIPQFGLPYLPRVESVWVGCTAGTSIRKEDVDLILNTFKENFEK